MNDVRPLQSLPGTSLIFSPRGKAKARLEDGRLVLTGEQRWLIEGDPDEVAVAAEGLEGLCEELRDGLLEVRFGNAVGVFSLGRLGQLEVVSGKWNRSHFDAMLADITATAAGLPFAAGTAGALPYDRSLAARMDLLYHAFVYLRHIIAGVGPAESQLMPALACILADPHRRWMREERRVPPELASRVDPASVVRIVQSGELLVRHTGSSVPLVTYLRGHLPLRVAESCVDTTVNTPENRFVKAFLQMAAGVIGEISRLAGSRLASATSAAARGFERRLIHECEEMAAAIDHIARHSLWDSVEDMVHFPASSTVLQRRRGYRDVLRHYARLRMATRLPLADDRNRDLLEIKDIAQLYELWCFFELVGGVTAVLGSPVKAASAEARSELEFTVKHDLEVAWANGTRLLYNPVFGPSRSGMRRSYSVGLRPDAALVVPHGPDSELHLLDAKFRLDRIGEVLPAKEDGEAERGLIAEERLGRFKRGDLYKMHTYRDAIRQARSVWILYPGTEMRFYPVQGRSALRELPTEHDQRDGVGAVPLRPESGGGTAMRRVVAALLDTGGS